MTDEACPEFPEATRRFRELLRDQGWPVEIRWVRAGDVRHAPGPEVIVYLSSDDDGVADAAPLFERGRSAGLGVQLQAVCTWGDVTVATVSHPGDGGLKLSVATPRLAGTARWAVC
jgi:hypothetical protein